MTTLAHADSFIEVPQPLFKYSGQRIIHDDNLSILSNHTTGKLLSKKQIKALEAQFKRINTKLHRAKADALIETESNLVQQFNSLKLDLEAYRHEYESEGITPERKVTIKLAVVPIREEMARLRKKVKKLNKMLRPMRDDIALRNEIKSQIEAHYAAQDDLKKESLLRKGMAKEAEIVAEQMSQTLGRLGFKHVFTQGNKTKTYYVQWDYVVATPDQLQFKVLASKQGLFGGSVDLMPDGTFVTDIIQHKVLRELSVALEREVWSPHTSEDQISLVNGAWIIVERLGLVEGIPTNVTYRQLMARYETADHSKFPIPAGLKRGRRINWVYLDSPSGIHLMFTGISGSGKSNAMRALVSAIIEKQSPRDINFVFIDLKKQGDFREFASAPHCLGLDGKGVLTEISEVVEVLSRIRSDMHARQTRIGHIANNLIDYNRRVKQEDRLPRIVIVFDEFANTRRTRYSDDADAIDDICIEIGQVGRAAGISMWIGIQQPRRDNMPPALRDNITTIFVGHQANVGAAQSVTGNRDSLKLEDYPGRMSLTVGWKTEKVQMPFISEQDVIRAVRIARDAYGDYRSYQLMESYDDSPQPETGYEIVLRTAFEEFDGALKYRPIADFLNGALSRSKVKELVSRMVEEGIIWEGRNYQAVKQPGNFYVLKVSNAVSQESLEDPIMESGI